MNKIDRFPSFCIWNQLIRRNSIVEVEAIRVLTYMKEMQSETKHTVTAYHCYPDNCIKMSTCGYCVAVT